jgi:hypothetical protein
MGISGEFICFFIFIVGFHYGELNFRTHYGRRGRGEGVDYSRIGRGQEWRGREERRERGERKAEGKRKGKDKRRTG